MIDVRWGRVQSGDKHVIIELEQEGAEYIAAVLRAHEAHDGGARAVAESIEGLLK